MKWVNSLIKDRYESQPTSHSVHPDKSCYGKREGHMAISIPKHLACCEQQTKANDLLCYEDVESGRKFTCEDRSWRDVSLEIVISFFN